MMFFDPLLQKMLLILIMERAQAQITISWSIILSFNKIRQEQALKKRLNSRTNQCSCTSHNLFFIHSYFFSLFLFSILTIT